MSNLGAKATLVNPDRSNPDGGQTGRGQLGRKASRGQLCPTLPGKHFGAFLLLMGARMSEMNIPQTLTRCGNGLCRHMKEFSRFIFVCQATCWGQPWPCEGAALAGATQVGATLGQPGRGNRQPQTNLAQGKALWGQRPWRGNFGRGNPYLAGTHNKHALLKLIALGSITFLDLGPARSTRWGISTQFYFVLHQYEIEERAWTGSICRMQLSLEAVA